MQTTPSTARLQGWGIAILRVVTGYLFLASGVHKIFVEYLGQSDSSIYVPIVVVGSMVELFCGAALIVGLLTRWVSVPLALLMLADVVVVHPPYEVFAQDAGYEYASLRLAACVALALTGSNKLALDNVFALRGRRAADHVSAGAGMVCPRVLRSAYECWRKLKERGEGGTCEKI
jgi:putative oxidoreductase